MAWKLMFLAALRYFSDSERSEVDRWDIPAGLTTTLEIRGKRHWKFEPHGPANLLATATLPYFLSLSSSHLEGHHLVYQDSMHQRHCEYHGTVELFLT
jgi:hypothetical protein